MTYIINLKYFPVEFNKPLHAALSHSDSRGWTVLHSLPLCLSVLCVLTQYEVCMHREVSHLGQLALATTLGLITCGYYMLKLNVTIFFTFPSFIFVLGLQVVLVEKAWFVVNWT